MPCSSDYLEANRLEREVRRAAKLLIYVYKESGRGLLPWAMKAADDYYGNYSESGDLPITELCKTMRELDEDELERIVYNARDPVARDLADWWEEHQEADRRREEKERAATEREIQSLKARLAELEGRVIV